MTSTWRGYALVVLAVVSCSPSRPVESAPPPKPLPAAPSTSSSSSSTAPRESACDEPLYDPAAVVAPKVDATIRVHSAMGEGFELKGFCILVDGRSVFAKSDVEAVVGGDGKGTAVFKGPLTSGKEHTMNATLVFSALSPQYGRVTLTLRGERKFTAAKASVITVEAMENSQAGVPLQDRPVLHFSVVDQ